MNDDQIKDINASLAEERESSSDNLPEVAQPSHKVNAKLKVEPKRSVFRIILEYVWLAGGVLLAALGLESFLLPNDFIDGGITGVSMLLSRLLGWPLSVLIVVVNIPFVIIGFRSIGTRFAVKSAVAILGLAVALTVVHFPILTNEHILGAVFGGFFLGAGVGLAIRSGGVLDGTEILAMIMSRKTFATVGEVILVLNAVIFCIAAFFFTIEQALYSMLTYFAASKTIDYLLHGIEAYNGVFIMTRRPTEVRQAILDDLGRGVTAFKAKGGYSQADNEVLFCVVTRLEITRLENLITDQDESAFIVTLPVLDTHGGVVKQRTFH